MKYTTKALKKMLIDSGIGTALSALGKARALSALSKTELLLIAFENGILKREDLASQSSSSEDDPPKDEGITEKRGKGRPRKYPPKQVDPNKTIDPKREFLLKIRTQPKRVIRKDVTTCDIVMYKSLYEAAKVNGHCPAFYSRNHGKIVGDYIFYVRNEESKDTVG